MTDKDSRAHAARRQVKPEEMGPLGPGEAPVKDPMKGLNGMISGTLVLEGIAILLALLVVLKIDGGAYWTTFNWLFIVLLSLAHFVLPAFVKKRWSLPVILAVQVIGLLGFFIHWSVGGVVLIFVLVWGLMLHLRSSLIARMDRGLLTTQHLNKK